MSAIQTPNATAVIKPRSKSSASPITKLITLLSSVRFGIVLLVLLGLACMVGMLIMQQSVQGFDKYYAELTPAQKLVYGSLGFFDIYHTWYFNALLMTLSLNIVLASIDRFPGTWGFIVRKRLNASRKFILGQATNATLKVSAEKRQDVIQRVQAACREVGLRPRFKRSEERSVVFAERGAWNRFGAYAVHAALLIVFLGFFLTAQYGRTGQMPLRPGDTSSEMRGLSFAVDQVSETTLRLPFSVTCTDIQQKLINNDGSLSAMNTIDWLTRIKIADETGEHEALVHLNEPYDYRGYRFFQASFVPTGNARNITLRLDPERGGESRDVTLQRNGSTTLADGTVIEFRDFFADFTLQGGRPDTASEEYNRPAAQLYVKTPEGQQKTVYAFATDLPEGSPVAAAFGGYKYRLANFEKAPTAHILSIQRDPGRYPFYIGGALLVLTLCSVFFFSHQRVWARVEESKPGTFEVTLGGDTNRGRLGFDDRFKRLTAMIDGQSNKVNQS